MGWKCLVHFKIEIRPPQKMVESQSFTNPSKIPFPFPILVFKTFNDREQAIPLWLLYIFFFWQHFKVDFEWPFFGLNLNLTSTIRHLVMIVQSKKWSFSYSYTPIPFGMNRRTISQIENLLASKPRKEHICKNKQKEQFFFLSHK